MKVISFMRDLIVSKYLRAAISLIVFLLFTIGGSWILKELEFYVLTMLFFPVFVWLGIYVVAKLDKAIKSLNYTENIAGASLSISFSNTVLVAAPNMIFPTMEVIEKWSIKKKFISDFERYSSLMHDMRGIVPDRVNFIGESELLPNFLMPYARPYQEIENFVIFAHIDKDKGIQSEKPQRIKGLSKLVSKRMRFAQPFDAKERKNFLQGILEHAD